MNADFSRSLKKTRDSQHINQLGIQSKNVSKFKKYLHLQKEENIFVQEKKKNIVIHIL